MKLVLLIKLCFAMAYLKLQAVPAEEVEVVKSIAEEKPEREDFDRDQVALESTDQDPSQSVYFTHHGVGSASPRVPPNLSPLPLNQQFGPPSSQLPYYGPPPPLPGHSASPADLKASSTLSNELWTSPVQDTPKIIALDVKCEKSGMKVFLQFDKPFYGIVFSKGHYSNINCIHLPAGLGRSSATFDIGLHVCGTSGNIENGLYGYGSESGSGTYFENIVVIQYDPQVQEVWDQARKLRCTWHDQYEKSVTFRPFPVDMLDVVRADFAGDNVGCWMQIQVGKGPWASEVSGLVKIGQTMTMVLAIKDDDSKFDMLVRNCMAHDGKKAPIQLVDQRGCVTRQKLMSRFTKIKNFGASASVLSYAHFQAFKFPDSMEVHFQCTIQICRYQCPDQCSESNNLEGHHLQSGPESQYGPPPPPPLSVESYLHGVGRPRDDRRVRHQRAINSEKTVGLNRIIKVVSSGDLTFPLDDPLNSTQATIIFPGREDGLICITAPGFTFTLVVLFGVLIASCILSILLYIRLRPYSFNEKEYAVAFTNPQITQIRSVLSQSEQQKKRNRFTKLLFS
ncbi:uncharacterized protein LOC119658443 [Hermetia illucens]|nr:uncharacterized protein LOC119658443 [Hermetia illucens]